MPAPNGVIWSATAIPSREPGRSIATDASLWDTAAAQRSCDETPHAVVVFLADVQPGPGLGHGHLRQLVVTFTLQTTSSALSYEAMESRIPMSGRVVAGSGRPSFWSHPTATGTEPYPEPRAHRSYE
ncbi:hypothetical protein GCM10009574_079970 [Streptomyces asiaticus]|uniref:Uncharacterized protein n=2 Tax=Streptomyces rhizosphaericus TaxID=114699 RepID=A0ABP4CYJ5_9ACTN